MRQALPQLVHAKLARPDRHASLREPCHVCVASRRECDEWPIVTSCRSIGRWIVAGGSLPLLGRRSRPLGVVLRDRPDSLWYRCESAAGHGAPFQVALGAVTVPCLCHHPRPTIIWCGCAFARRGCSPRALASRGGSHMVESIQGSAPRASGLEHRKHQGCYQTEPGPADAGDRGGGERRPSRGALGIHG